MNELIDWTPETTAHVDSSFPQLPKTTHIVELLLPDYSIQSVVEKVWYYWCIVNVYFSASMSKYRKLLPLTSDIARMIEDLGHTITSKHVTKKETTKGEWTKQYDPQRLYEREVRRLASSDVLITEVTTPSFGGGFMIQTAIALGKPLLSLHYGIDEEKIPLMLRGHKAINLKLYTEENARGVLKKFFDNVKVVEPMSDFDQ